LAFRSATETIGFLDAEQITGELARQLEAICSDASRYAYRLPVIAARPAQAKLDAG
jgi:hypothetical protein